MGRYWCTMRRSLWWALLPRMLTPPSRKVSLVARKKQRSYLILRRNKEHVTERALAKRWERRCLPSTLRTTTIRFFAPPITHNCRSPHTRSEERRVGKG